MHKISEEVKIYKSNILEEVIILNNKGYKTLYSCGGHTNEDEYGMYISFAKNHHFNILPNGWFEHQNTINYKVKKRKYDISYDVALQNFKIWVKQLPKLI